MLFMQAEPYAKSPDMFREDSLKAKELYEQAIKLDPKLANAFENRGHAYHAKGDDGRASSDFEEAARLDPKLAEALKAISTKP